MDGLNVSDLLLFDSDGNGTQRIIVSGRTYVVEPSDPAVFMELEMESATAVFIDTKNRTNVDCLSSSNSMMNIFASGLLGHPYTVDCKDAILQARNAESGSLLIARGSLTQVLPAEGKYSVFAQAADSERFESVLFAESQFLRLDIPPEHKISVLDRMFVSIS